MLELGRRVGKHLDGLLEERHALVATLDQTGDPQGSPERPRGAPRPSVLEVLGRKPPGLVLLAQLCESEGGLSSGRHECWIAASNRLEAVPRFAHRFDPAGQVTPEQAEARPAVE